MADLITGYIHRPIVDYLDMKTLERCNGSYVTPQLTERHSDLVWRITARDRRSVFVYLHLEFQSRIDRSMAVRLMVYTGLLWQNLIAQKALPRNGLLPRVLPIVLYKGPGLWTAPVQLRTLVSPTSPQFAHGTPRFRYHVINESHVPTDHGVRSRNTAAALFALGQATTTEQHRALVEQVQPWIANETWLDHAFGAWYGHTQAPKNKSHMHVDSHTTFTEIAAMMGTFAQELRDKVGQATKKGERRGEKNGEVRGIRRTNKKHIDTLVRLGLLTTDVIRTLSKKHQTEHVLSAALRLLAKKIEHPSPRTSARQSISL